MQKGQRDRYLILGVTAIVAAVLLCLAVPRSIAGFMSIEGDRALSSFLKDNDRLSSLSDTVLATRHDALNWINSARYHRDIGMIKLALAASQNEESDATLYTEARNSNLTAIKGAPADSLAWLNLATGEILNNGSIKKAVSALTQSYLVSQFYPEIVIRRLYFSLPLWNEFQIKDRKFILNQMPYAWWIAPREVLNLATTPLNVAIIRAGMANDERAYRQFNEGYARSLKPNK